MKNNNTFNEMLAMLEKPDYQHNHPDYGWRSSPEFRRQEDSDEIHRQNEETDWVSLSNYYNTNHRTLKSKNFSKAANNAVNKRANEPKIVKDKHGQLGVINKQGNLIPEGKEYYKNEIKNAEKLLKQLKNG